MLSLASDPPDLDESNIISDYALSRLLAADSRVDDGIGVSVLCPQYVATQMIGMGDLEDTAELAPGILTAAEVADAVINGLAEKQFLILPHQEVERFRQNKAKNIDIWLAKMRKLRQNIMGTGSNLAI